MYGLVGVTDASGSANAVNCQDPHCGMLNTATTTDRSAHPVRLASLNVAERVFTVVLCRPAKGHIGGVRSLLSLEERAFVSVPPQSRTPTVHASAFEGFHLGH